VHSFGDKLFTQLETFGTGADARWQARDIRTSEAGTTFRVFRDGREWAEFTTPLVGTFNVRNCLAVIVAAQAWGLTTEAIAKGLRTFRS
ncbi:Mur ligase family protein, partial [Acinetobacter baumannii]